MSGIDCRPLIARIADGIAHVGRTLARWWPLVVLLATIAGLVVLAALFRPWSEHKKCEKAGGEIQTYNCRLVGRVTYCDWRCLVPSERGPQ